MRALWLAAVLPLLFSCATGPLAAHRARVARSAPRRARVALRVIDGNLRVVVGGRVAGREATWVLDTGSAVDGLSQASAESAGLGYTRDSQTALLRADGQLTVEPVTRPVSIAVFDDGAEPRAPLAILPSGDVGATGSLSPQRRAPDAGAVELDLARGELLELHGADATGALDDVARVGTKLAPWPNMTGTFIPTVEATIDGRRSVLIVDTGAPVSTLYADTDAGVTETMRATSHALMGSDAFDHDEVALVPSATVRVAATTVAGPIAIIGRSPSRALAGIDGSLGLDVLRNCTLVLTRTSGAMACEAPRGRSDPMPTLVHLSAVAASEPLHARALAPPPGAVARFGCEALTEADLAEWARSRGYAADGGHEAGLRARAFSRAAAELGIVIDNDDIERAVDAKRAELGPDGFAAALATSHLTLGTLRARFEDQIRETKVGLLLAPRAFGGAASEAMMTRAADALAAQIRDRLARVAVRREGGRCEETWPRFYLEQIEIEGLAPADEHAVRLALARRLEGGAVSLGMCGTIPSSLAQAVSSVFRARGLEARLASREDGDRLHLGVTLSRRE